MDIQNVYFAGPDVFRPDAAAYGRRLIALCAEFGLTGIFPFDDSTPTHKSNPFHTARQIYLMNIAQIEKADAVIANLDFFRGTEPDSGTCFEVGYAVARGKPVVGYVPDSGTYLERTRRRNPAMAGRGQVDAHGWQIEDFNLPLNLMLAVPCRIVVGDARTALLLLCKQVRE